MVGRGAATAIAQSRARRGRLSRREESQRSSAPAATDKLAPMRPVTPPAAQQRPRPDGKICGEEVSWALSQIHRRPCALALAANGLSNWKARQPLAPTLPLK